MPPSLNLYVFNDKREILVNFSEMQSIALKNMSSFIKGLLGSRFEYLGRQIIPEFDYPYKVKVHLQSLLLCWV